MCALVCLAGCAGVGSGGATVRDDDSRAAIDCFLNRPTLDYSRLDDSNLIIEGAGSSAYHVVLSSRSVYLRDEIAIGLVDNDGDGRICPFGGDRILVAGTLTEEIPIRSITLIDEDEVEGLKIQFGVIESADEGAVTITEIQ